jgi:hypothetical protein
VQSDFKVTCAKVIKIAFVSLPLVCLSVCFSELLQVFINSWSSCFISEAAKEISRNFYILRFIAKIILKISFQFVTILHGVIKLNTFSP